MAIVLNNVTSGYNLSTINSNFQKIEDYVNDKLLARANTGVAGEAMMGRDLDMNGHALLNVFVDVNNAGSLLTVGVADARYYNVAGDTLTGPMNVNSQVISGLPSPTLDSQAATKGYVDALANIEAANNARSLRVPESSVNELPDSLTRRGKVHTYDAATGQPLLIPAGQLSVGDILNLSSADGLKYIGRCQDIATLRTVEPTNQGQKIEVVSYYNDWAATAYGPIGGGEFYYDSSDTTSLDDGLTVFVTAGGKRWKRKLADGNLSFQMGGVRPGQDCTSVFKKLVLMLLTLYNSVSTGDKIPYNYKNFAITCLPGTYILTETVQLYTVTPFKPMGDVTFDARSITTGVGIFNLSNDGLLKKPKYLGIGPILNGTDGTITIVGSETVPGLAVGNTLSGMVDFAGYITHNIQISYVSCFMHFRGAIDTYLLKFTRTGAYGCSGIGIHFSQTTFSNSGERISFDELTLGGCTGNFIQVDQPGVMLSFSNMSLDFTSSDALVVSATCAYAQIDITDSSHVEAVNGYFIKSMNSTTKVLWDGGQWLPTSRSGGGQYNNYQGRPLVYGYLNTVKLRDIQIFNSYAADNENVYIGIPSNPGSTSIMDASGIFDTYGSVPSKTCIANRGNNFSLETVGTVLGGTTLTAFKKPEDVTSWRGTVTGQIVSLSDGTKALQLTPDTPGTTGNYLVLTTTDYLPVIPAMSRVKGWAVGQILNSTLRLRIQLQMKWYDADKNLLSTTTSGGISDLVTNANVTTLPSYSTDPTVNGNRKLATTVNGHTSPAGACYARPVWTISGIDQTVNINELNVTVGSY